MRDTGISRDNEIRPCDQRGEFDEAGSCRVYRVGWYCCRLRDRNDVRQLRRRSGQGNTHAVSLQNASDIDPANYGPAARSTRSTGMKNRRTRHRRETRHRHRQIEVLWIRAYPRRCEHPAPALHFVLVGTPTRALCALRDVGVGKGDEAPRSRRKQDMMARRSAPVKIDGNVGLVQLDGQRSQGLHVDTSVKRSAEFRKLVQNGGCGKYGLGIGKSAPDRPVGRHAGEEITKP